MRHTRALARACACAASPSSQLGMWAHEASVRPYGTWVHETRANGRIIQACISVGARIKCAMYAAAKAA